MQIGLVVLVGLACKNAILIVEFAKQLRDEGKPRLEATREASRLRLRPILMTSFAFILGVVPLVIADGAGAEMRQSLGTAVFSGMLGVTLFGIFLTPVFFYVIDGLGRNSAVHSPRVRRNRVGSRFCAGSAVGRPGRVCFRWRARLGRRASLRCDHRRSDGLSVAVAGVPDRVPALLRRLTDTNSHPAGGQGTRHDFSFLHRSARSLPRCCRSSSRWRDGVAVFTLPVAQYPDVTPPTVLVTAFYPGSQRADGARHRRRADRGAGQRRREHDVHVVAVAPTTARTR